MWIIYGLRFRCVKHRFDGKVRYVGQTVSPLQSRWMQHCAAARKGARTAIAATIRKYGPSAFEIIELGQAPTLLEANKMEIEYIRRLDLKISSKQGGLNILPGGGAIDVNDPVIKSKNRKAWRIVRERMTPEILAANARAAVATKGPAGLRTAAQKAATTRKLRKLMPNLSAQS